MKLQRSTTLLTAIGTVAALSTPALAQQGETTTAAKLPRLQVSETEFNFGRVAQGSTISHVFWLKNVGADTLRITDVKPG